MTLRVLGAIRLSRNTDESTSPKRQTERIDWWTAGHDCELVHIAEDLDVSGKVSPFDRDGLGEWLKDENAHKWDVLVAWKLDRISRSAEDTLKLLKWCEEHGKRIVCVDDGLDTETKMGRVWIQLAAIFAEVERSFIEERTQASRDELRQQGRWAGGTPPYGYTKEKREDGGWYLVEDPERAAIVRKMARMIIDTAGQENEESYRSVAKWLNDEEVPTPRASNKRGWSNTRVKLILENPTIRWGKAVHKGQIIEHVKYAEPLLSTADAFRLDTAMSARAKAPRGRAPKAMLTGVVWCACGEKMYRSSKQTKVLEYRCSGRFNHRTGCTMKNVKAAEVETFVETEFLNLVGTLPLMERIEHPASDNTVELETVKVRIAKLAAMFTSGALDEEDENFTASLHALKKRRKELAARPNIPAWVEHRPTNVHYLDIWQEGDDAARRSALLGHSAKVIVQAGEPGERLTFRMDPVDAEALTAA
ncbi:recombinase family protein [Amycolatopsis sp. lyj-23]|uniref:recombinase family protein n=1 Tax=Amycolatopsis sp. lyj-23 TaxID=2789283 RepID=UPI003979AE61